VRLFADRLEIQSPGGLYGNVNEENLEDEHSTRNVVLMRLMEDLHLVENRGSGIKTMLEAMRQANLEPPRFHDRRSSFWVTFRNHSLMSPAAVAWLNQFAALPLNDRQRLALVYLRNNERIANNEYQRLNRVDSVTAGRELRGLVQADLIEQQSAKRWTYYTLKVARKLPAPPASDEEKVVAYVGQHGSINNTECRDLLGYELQKCSRLLKSMRRRGLLKSTGERRWTRYQLP
jgi:ATP-dependent DNA helicase RecG